MSGRHKLRRKEVVWDSHHSTTIQQPIGYDHQGAVLPPMLCRPENHRGWYQYSSIYWRPIPVLRCHVGVGQPIRVIRIYLQRQALTTNQAPRFETKLPIPYPELSPIVDKQNAKDCITIIRYCAWNSTAVYSSKRLLLRSVKIERSFCYNACKM